MRADRQTALLYGYCAYETVRVYNESVHSPHVYIIKPRVSRLIFHPSPPIRIIADCVKHVHMCTAGPVEPEEESSAELYALYTLTPHILSLEVQGLLASSLTR